MGNLMSSGPSGKGGANKAEANMVGYVSSEEDLEATYAWDASDDMAYK